MDQTQKLQEEEIHRKTVCDFPVFSAKGYIGIKEDAVDPTALFRIGYGLYLVSAREGEKDNGLIVNTVVQVTNTPNRVAVTVHKSALTHDMILHTGVMNVSCLTVKTPYSIFELFGMKSGKTVEKFRDLEMVRSANGVAFLPGFSNAFFSLKVEQYADLGTHGMFLCAVTEAQVLQDLPTVTYDDYRTRIKPRPEKKERKGFVCRVCGYVYEGEELPESFVCPLCLHGAADFEPL
ncbi:MAG: flavin reductase [Clostridia bacterium]|nr:flavin reductase [Clostridia bacterium]